MDEYRFSLPIQLRYADIDAQWHVNNARFATFLEQARFSYLKHLGLVEGDQFLNLGVILADVHIRYIAPILLDDAVRVGVRAVSLGNKSFQFEYRIDNPQTGQVFATAETVMVTYDYHELQSIPIPLLWREKIAAFEGIAMYRDSRV